MSASAMRHDAVDVAAALGALDGRRPDDARTAWLIYVCDGWSLAIRGHGMVNERPRAGTTGPLYASLGDEGGRRGDRAALDAEASDIVGRVSRRYGDLTLGELATLNLHEGNPWYDASRAGGPIAAEASRAHFRALALAGRDRAGRT